MKKIFLAFALICGPWVNILAQLTYVAPASQVANIFTNANSPRVSGCLQNQGQNIWTATYIVSSGAITSIQFRLEYSFNSDAATCSTGTWFQMSDDATDLTQGAVVGVGNYPFVRANLVVFQFAVGNPKVTANYTTTSAQPVPTFGFYNTSQQIRKVVYERVTQDSSAAPVTIPAIYGSSSGQLIVVPTTTAFAGGSSIQIAAINGEGISSSFAATLPTSLINISFAMPSGPATSLKISYVSGGVTGGTFSVYYIFYPPGSGFAASDQPALTLNSESTGVASTVTATLSAQTFLRNHLFQVTARCSAGTAQLTVADAGAQLWSSGTTEVGTTSFIKSWNPSLTGFAGNAMTISLSTCGGTNTGTLDVQASAF